MAISLVEALFLGVDTALIFTFYKFYKQHTITADLIEKAPIYEVGEELVNAVDKSECNCLPYVGVVGVTKSLEGKVVSARVDCEGLVLHTDILQHRCIRFHTGWQDITTSVGSSTNLCRFGMVSSQKADLLIEVSEPLKSEYLLEHLPIINHLYEPSQQAAFSQGLDVLVGSIIKGHSFTEKMLAENTPILAIGRITNASKLPLYSHNLLLTPPLNQNHPFILTTLSRSELLSSKKSEAHLMKLLCYTFSAIGIGITSYLFYRYLQKKRVALQRWWHRVQDKTPLLIDTGINASTSFASRTSSVSNSSCVICLTGLRDLVLMPCKHLCICSHCFEQLPAPKKCPVCRTSVNQSLFVYVS